MKEVRLASALVVKSAPFPDAPGGGCGDDERELRVASEQKSRQH